MPAFYNREKLKGTNKNSGDAVRGMDFDCEVAGLTIGGMVEFKGFEFRYDVTEFWHAESKLSHTRPGHPKKIQIELTREYVNKEMTFRNWNKAVEDGKVDRRTVSLKFKADNGTQIAQCDFFNAWPSEYHPPAMTVAQSAHAVERLVIQCDDWKFKMG